MSGWPLVSVADISYPVFSRRYGDVVALLTHGHAHEWGWRFLSGSPEANTGERWLLTGITTVLAHRFARQLRHLFNLGDTAIDWVKRVQDVAFEITNVHLQRYGVASLRTLDGQTEFADELEQVFRELCDEVEGETTKLLHRRSLEAVRKYHRVRSQI